MILISAWALFLLANILYRPLFSDMLIFMTGEAISVPSVVMWLPFRMSWASEGGLPMPFVGRVEYTSISLSPVSEIDVRDRVYWD